jgi:RNA polymerase sigma-70 factor, ECF subfamily
MPQEESDEMLMAAMASGDQRSLRILMDRHMTSVIRLSERILMSRSEADDIAQEAFFRVWRNAARFDPNRASFKTWLYRIVVNLAIDRKRRPVPAPIEAAADQPCGAPDALATVIEAERQRDMKAALAALPENQRMAIALFHFEGLSARDGAAAMSLSAKAFESLLIRARRALKQQIADEQTARQT